MTTPIKKRNVGHLTRITHLNKSGYFTWKLLRILYLDDLDVPIKKNKNRKNERDEITNDEQRANLARIVQQY